MWGNPHLCTEQSIHRLLTPCSWDAARFLALMRRLHLATWKPQAPLPSVSGLRELARFSCLQRSGIASRIHHHADRCFHRPLRTVCLCSYSFCLTVFNFPTLAFLFGLRLLR